MDLFVPCRPNQPPDITQSKEVPNGVATWNFNDLGARAPCSCSRYDRPATKLFSKSIILTCSVFKLRKFERRFDKDSALGWHCIMHPFKPT